jgi:hypothetical protein
LGMDLKADDSFVAQGYIILSGRQVICR